MRRAILCILGLCGLAAAQQTLIVRGKIFGHDSADAVLIDGDRIVAIGRSEELSELAGNGVRRIDAAGGHVLPGFHDAHIHMLSGGLSLDRPDLSELRTVALVQAALRAFAEAHPEADWIEGRGWQYDLVEPGSYPNRQMLDAAVPDRPVLLESYDGHAVWANTVAIGLAGLEGGPPDPENGRIVREADGVTPAGVFLEDAAALVEDAVPELDREAMKVAISAALAHCLQLGITAVSDIASDTAVFWIYRELEAESALPLRVTVGLPLDSDLDALVRLRMSETSRVRLGFLKAFLDGVIESKTAWMLEPYSGSDECGAPQWEEQTLLEHVLAAQKRGFPVAVHAIGDAAVRCCLSVFSAAREEPGATMRNRIEHIEILEPEDAPRFAASGTIASMQPFHANPWGDSPETGAWSENLGSERLPLTFPWRTLSEAGATLAFGSDWPVMSADPLQGVAVARWRRDEQGRPKDGWIPEQCIDWTLAVKAYSEGSAAAIGREVEIGRLSEGFLADICILDPRVSFDDPTTLWSGRRVRCVIVGGVVEHLMKGGR